jgi:hypothetical protein
VRRVACGFELRKAGGRRFTPTMAGKRSSDHQSLGCDLTSADFLSGTVGAMS